MGVVDSVESKWMSLLDDDWFVRGSLCWYIGFLLCSCSSMEDESIKPLPSSSPDDSPLPSSDISSSIGASLSVSTVLMD